jgi:hypothetical protein
MFGYWSHAALADDLQSGPASNGPVRSSGPTRFHPHKCTRMENLTLWSGILNPPR